MTLHECLTAIGTGHQEWLRTWGLHSVAQGLIRAVITALMLAVVLAPLCQRAYSRRMQRLMHFREVTDAPPAWWRRRSARLRTPLPEPRNGSIPLAEAMRQRERRIRIATWISYAVLVVAGAAAVPWSQSDRSVGNLVAMLMYVVLMALGPAMVNIRPYGAKRALLLAAIGLVVVDVYTGAVAPQAFAVVLVTVVMMCLYAVTVHRTIRAIVVPLLLLCAGGTIGYMASEWIAVPLQQCLDVRVPEHDLGMRGYLLFVVAGGYLLTSIVVLGLWSALFLLGQLVRVIERGWLSDISLVAGAGYTIIAGLLAMSGDAPGATVPLLTLLFCGWLGAALGAYALALHLQPCPHEARRLLLLRVFSRQSRAERLLDALQARWRLAGPVLEIGGPDLATLNLDLHEFVHFLRSRLHDLLHPRGASFGDFAASLDLAMDREGRFRVNEVFCFDTSWHDMLERLLALSDAVLLDLRGFDSRRSGTTHEVARLAALGLLVRVVAVYDSRTDWNHFEMSTAGSGAMQQLALKVDASDSAAIERCLTGLLQIAEKAAVRTAG